MSAAGDELLKGLHDANVALLDKHMDETVLELMDRAALAAHQQGANTMASMIGAALVVMKAKL